MAIVNNIIANCESTQLSQQMISRQWDDKGTLIQFAGYPQPDNDEALIFRLIVWMKESEDAEPRELPPILLDADQWLVSNYYTQLVQTIKFQLCITNESGTFEKHSPIFAGHIGKSLSHNGQEGDIDVIPLFDPYKNYVDERVSELIVAAGDVQIDAALRTSGAAADAKTTGDAIAGVNGRLDEQEESIDGLLDDLTIFSVEHDGIVPKAPADSSVGPTSYVLTKIGTAEYSESKDGDNIVITTALSGNKWGGVRFGTTRAKFKGGSYCAIGYSATHVVAFSGDGTKLYKFTIGGDGNNYVTLSTNFLTNILSVQNNETDISVDNNVLTIMQNGVVTGTTDVSTYMSGMTPNIGNVWLGVDAIVGTTLVIYPLGDEEEKTPSHKHFLRSDGTWVEIQSETSNNPWVGKSWYAYGTSITNISNEGRYPTKLAQMSGLNLTNKGISGGGIGDLGAYSRGQVYNAICNVTDGKTSADLITLETGANDIGASVPLGTIYDTGRTTLSGCLNDCLRYLQANTNAQIVVFLSPASTTEPTAGGKYYEWAKMVEEICNINRVHFVNANCNLGYAKLTSSNGSRYIVDNIHQTELGGYIYAQNIWSQLKNIPLFYTELPT